MGRGVLCKVLYREAPPLGATPHPFVYQFDRKSTPSVHLKLKMPSYLAHIMNKMAEKEVFLSFSCST